MKTLINIGALASILWTPTTQGQNTNDSSSVPCQALLSANLTSRVLLPNDPLYEPRVQSYFIGQGRLHPWCFFLPQSASELSTGIKVLSTAAAATSRLHANNTDEWHIAVRSGGHMYPGSNNIVNGVTIDLGNLNASSYNPSTKLASLEPGARWANVNRNLVDNFNVTVTGGRNGDVGVGGFLLGGGNSYYTGRVGFGCDTVVNYQVVLADGSIVNANKNEHPDLYKALKGGGLNFGIVTRFDVEALPAVDLAIGQTWYEERYAEQIVDALAEFTGTTDLQSGDHAFTLVGLGGGESVVMNMFVNTKSDLITKGFEAFEGIPAEKKSWGLESLADAVPADEKGAEANVTSYTLTTKNSRLVHQHILAQYRNLYSTLNTIHSATGTFSTILILQPIPAYYARLTQRNGGKVLGLDSLDADATLYVFAITALAGGDAAVAVADAELKALLAEASAFAKAQGQDVEWVYLNYANEAQDPLASYGEENLMFLREVQGMYDPEGWWQEMVPRGFKLDRAGR